MAVKMYVDFFCVRYFSNVECWISNVARNLAHAVSGVSSQRNARNVRNVTKWRHNWIGQSQPPATTAYAAGTLPRCGRRAKLLKLNSICIISGTTSKKRTKIWTIFFNFQTLKTWVQLERGWLGFYWLKLAFLTRVAFTVFPTLLTFIALRALRGMETPL